MSSAVRAVSAVAAVVVMILSSVAPAGAEEQAKGARAAEKKEARAREAGGTFEWRDHPSVKFGEYLKLDFRARIQTETINSPADDDDEEPARFDLARRRVGVSGVVANIVEFQIERELMGRSAWRDVFANVRHSDRLQLQGGRFKLPFSLEENTSATKLDFAYRSRAASLLAPGRDRGVMAHGRVSGVRYALGVFDHDGENARGRNGVRVFGGRTTAGRLTVEPMRSSRSVLEDLQVGLGYTTSDVPEGIADLRGETQFGQTFFPAAFAVQGQRQRVGIEARWRPGPFSVQSEYIRLASERRAQGVGDTDLPKMVAAGWYVSGTWIATGERKKKGAFDPRRPLFDGGVGAIELAARFEALGLGSGGDGPASTAPRAETIAPHANRALTFGVNWSPNRWIRVQANVLRDTLTLPSSVDSTQPAFWSRVIRFQFEL